MVAGSMRVSLITRFWWRTDWNDWAPTYNFRPEVMVPCQGSWRMEEKDGLSVKTGAPLELGGAPERGL